MAPETGKSSGKADEKHNTNGHTGHESGHHEPHKLFGGVHKHPAGEQRIDRKSEEKIKDLEKRLEDSEKKYEEMLDTARRLKAEYENFKKRSDAMFLDRVDLEKIRVLLEFLPTYDNMERALNAMNMDHKIEDFATGVEMIAKQFKASFDRLGVTEIADKNCPFDPEIHEALTMRENPNIQQETVTEIFEKGYKLNGRIIRHAKVVVDIPSGREEKSEEEPAKDVKEQNQSHDPEKKGTDENPNENNSGGTNG